MEGDPLPVLDCDLSITYFNPLPPCGGRQVQRQHVLAHIGISIHSLRVEGDQANLLPMLASMISIHSLRVEGDRRPHGAEIPSGAFQSTPSVWRETMAGRKPKPTNLFQSTPSVWRETGKPYANLATTRISIHSLRVEGDQIIRDVFGIVKISIHSLRVEGDRLI